MSEIDCLKPSEPLFLVNKYIDSSSHLVCRQDSTAQERREAIAVVIDHVWPGLDDRRRKPILNVFIKLMAFTRKHRFNAPRIATSVSILFEVMLILSKRQLPQPEYVFSEFQSILIRHSIKRTPFSIAIFSLVEVKLLTQFFLDRVLRYCHLYQYLLGKSQHLRLHFYRSIAPLPSVIRPLSHASPVLPEPLLPSESESKPQASDDLTPDQIQMILSDPVAKARFESLVQPRLAELQARLDRELEVLDRIYSEKQSNRKA